MKAFEELKQIYGNYIKEQEEVSGGRRMLSHLADFVPEALRLIVSSHDSLTEEQKEMIRGTAERNGIRVIFSAEQGDPELFSLAEVIFGYPPAGTRLGERLKWMCIQHAGVERLMEPGVLPEHVMVTNSSGAYGTSLAEHVIMLTLMLLRREPEFFDAARRREWHEHLWQHSIRDSRITLLGAGDIGRCCAQRLKGFLPKQITAVNASGNSREPSFDRVVPVSELDRILPETDILIMSLPHTAATEGILSVERIALLPESAYIINVGRGSAIDEPALREALNSGKLAGAALDVMRHEPLPADDPLWDTKNLLITPHVAGNLTVDYTCQRVVEMFCEDLENYAAGRPLHYLVDRSLGY